MRERTGPAARGPRRVARPPATAYIINMTAHHVTAIDGSIVQFAAVYAIGPALERQPVLIGHGRKPDKALRDLQATRDGTLAILAQAWFVELTLARRVRNRCDRILTTAKKELGDDWFDIDDEWAKRVIGFAARQEGIPIYKSAERRKLEISNADLNAQNVLRHIDMILDRGHRDE
jgi:hypothetical protein